MLDMGYLIKEENRLFINTSLGCKSKCKYCYLPKLGYEIGLTSFPIKTKEEILSYIYKYNIKIDKSDIITFGCFSECMDHDNKKHVLDLIKYFLENGNQVQLATKKKIKQEDIDLIKDYISYEGQLIIFISCACITNDIELLTDSALDRFENFKLLKNNNITTCLYIKPVLKDITIQDLCLYEKYIKKYNIEHVVVGSIFGEVESLEKVDFISNKKLYYNEVADEEIIKNKLKKLTNVYGRSREVLKKYK